MKGSSNPIGEPFILLLILIKCIYMKTIKSEVLTALVCFILCSCSSVQNIEGNNISDEILKQTKATKILNAFDEEACDVYWIEPGDNAPKATIEKSVDRVDKIEGKGSFMLKYSFAGVSTNANTEYVFLEERCADFRPDLSFYPLGLSIWIKGKTENNDILRIMFIQDETLTAQRENCHYFAYTNDTILGEGGWRRLVIPYTEFKHYKGDKNEKMDLSRFVAYQINVINKDGKAHSGEFKIDDLEQLTSYKPEYKTPQFSSLFIQLSDEYQGENWDTAFKACKEININTWIIQYCQGFGVQNNVSWYSGSKVPWNETEYSIVDEMVKAAERQNFKLIFGLYGGDYVADKNDPVGYNNLYDKNKQVIDELYDKFAASPCFAGWYITEEFHDGSYPDGCWQNNPARDLLADYLQKVAAYCKSKPNKFPVQIAPGLFRGKPADLCGEWYKNIFERTPDIDYLYLQDIGGRCLVDIDVDLPNYFAQIKKACDETGVEFGVDVESFLGCGCPNVPYHAKNWNELKEQLFVAGMFTNNITNFSWATFKPGTGAFAGYKAYLKENSLIK